MSFGVFNSFKNQMETIKQFNLRYKRIVIKPKKISLSFERLEDTKKDISKLNDLSIGYI